MRMRARTGMTVVELTVAVALLAGVALLAATVLDVQRRGLALAAGDAAAHTTLRHAAAPVVLHLRATDAVALPLAIADTAVESIATIGEAVVCGAGTDPTQVVLAPHPWTAWRIRPDADDLALALRRAPGADEWLPHGIVTLQEAPALTCAAESGALALGGGPPLLLRLVAPVTHPIVPGTAIRFARRVRWSLYRTGDGSWALGHRRCPADPTLPCGGIQPVAGPLRATSVDPGRTGLRVGAILSGAATGPDAPPVGAPRALELVLRAPRSAPGGLRPPRRGAAQGHDSLHVRIAIRSPP